MCVRAPSGQTVFLFLDNPLFFSYGEKKENEEEGTGERDRIVMDRLVIVDWARHAEYGCMCCNLRYVFFSRLRSRTFLRFNSNRG